MQQPYRDLESMVPSKLRTITASEETTIAMNPLPKTLQVDVFVNVHSLRCYFQRMKGVGCDV